MGFGLTAVNVAEYAAQPFIRTALAHPRSTKSVLSFFLGIDYESPTAEKELESGAFLTKMSPFWFAGHVDYDGHCKSAFESLIREAGKKELKDVKEWNDTVNGQVAQLILCDQLSRNVFRGSEEAFAYDDTSLDIAKLLASDCMFSDIQTLEGIFYPSYSAFAATALMHSEKLEDHELCLDIINWAIKESPKQLREEWWDGQKEFALEHKVIVERFGRYPHRNVNKGRESTDDEVEWLADVDGLPMWAKSQL